MGGSGMAESGDLDGGQATSGFDSGPKSVACLTTLGSAGAVAIGPDGDWRVEPLQVTPVDTTGAGDAFIGTLAAGLDDGQELTRALHRASVAAGLCCAGWGTQTSFPWAEDIDARLADLALPRPLG